MSNNKHLILENRYTIEQSLDERLSFKAIGLSIGKDCTTVSKEIRNHISLKRLGLLTNLLMTVSIEKSASMMAMAVSSVPEKAKQSVPSAGYVPLKNALIM